MQKYDENKSQFHGILVKSSDMSYELKIEITKLLKEMIDRTPNDDEATKKISEGLTRYMEAKHAGAWICIIGRKFTANVMHEPGYFLRASTEDYHILVIKLKIPAKKETSKLLRKATVKSTANDSHDW